MIDASGIRASLQPFLSLALLAAVGASLVASPGPDGLFGAFLGLLMLAIAITDSRRYIIPNELTAAAFGAGAAARRHRRTGRGLARRALGGVAGRRDRGAVSGADDRLPALARPRRARPRRHQTRRRRRRLARLGDDLCRDRTRRAVGARRLFRERISSASAR